MLLDDKQFLGTQKACKSQQFSIKQLLMDTAKLPLHSVGSHSIN